MKKTLKKILNIFADIIVVLILIVSIFVVVLSLTSKSQGVPNLLGYAPLSVQSDSMKDTFSSGDLIIGKVTDISDTFEVGDVVTFPIKIQGVNTLNTHRIVEIVEDDDITYYRTQGDNKNTNPEPDEDLQTSTSIVAKYTGTKIPGVGNILSFIRTQLGFFLCVLLPMIIFFVYEAIRVIMNLLAYNKEKALKEAQESINNAELTEEQKQRAIEEYLASIGENKEDNATAQTPTEACPSDNTSDNAE